MDYRAACELTNAFGFGFSAGIAFCLVLIGVVGFFANRSRDP